MNIANDKYKFDEIFLICMIFSKSKQKIDTRILFIFFELFYDSTFPYNTKF